MHFNRYISKTMH